MIRTCELAKTYRNRQGRLGRRRWVSVEAVTGLTMEVPRGKIVGLLGLNGAGKTTTVKMLATLLEPTSGRAEVGGFDLVRDAAKIRGRINLIAGGERMLYWRLTARENLWYFGQMYNVPARALRPRIDALLREVGLEDAAGTRVEQFSRGMKQRLQVARGLINEPEYLFLDEPTLGLDVNAARHVRRLVRALADRDGRAVLLTSHYMAEVEELCDYIYVIDRGRMVASGTSGEITAMTGQKVVVSLLLASLDPALEAEARSHLGALGGAMKVERRDDGVAVQVSSERDLTAEAVSRLAAGGSRILRLEIVEPTLEDAIVAMSRPGVRL